MSGRRTTQRSKPKTERTPKTAAPKAAPVEQAQRPPPLKRGVSVRALIQRLRRVLPKEQKLVCSSPTTTTDGQKTYPNDVGRFYLVDNEQIAEHHIDLDAFGRRLSVLQPWEVLLET